MVKQILKLFYLMLQYLMLQYLRGCMTVRSKVMLKYYYY